MKNALSAKNKLGFITGDIEEPEATNGMFWPWTRCNIMVLSWIQQSVEAGIRKTILGFKTAVEAWESLKNRYGQGDVIRIAEIQEELSNLKQGNQSITEYHGCIITLRDELRNYQPLMRCDCTPASHLDCRAVKLMEEYEETNAVIHFLRGLNENFAGPRTQVLFGDKLPSLERVVQRMVQHERQLFGTQGKASPDGIAMAIQKQGQNSMVNFAAHQHNSNQSYGSGGKPKLYCTFCKMTNHTEDRCYFKNGFPPGMEPRMHPGSSNFKQRNPNAKFRPRANAAYSSEGNGVQMSQDQFNQLMAMMEVKNKNASHPDASTGAHSVAAFTQQPPGKSIEVLSMQALKSKDHEKWILDTGASDHVTCLLSNFSTFNEVDNVIINLPTGHQVHATHIGSVILSAQLTLNDVLYVPDFNFNLISVSKLAANQALCLTFASDSCLIQDKHRKITIGSAKLHQGLYHMSPAILVSQATSTTTTPTDVFDLWHHRLGHVSHSRIPYLHTLDPTTSPLRRLPLC